MLSIGDKFPQFKLKATVGIDSLDSAFADIDNDTYKGKWTLVFFYPKDFTFVCPTEIKGFGDLNQQFLDRDCQVLAASTDSEFVHLAWRKDHKDLRDLPFPMLADIKKDLTSALGILTERRRGAARDVPGRSGRHHPFRLRHRRFGRPQPAGSAARARRAADRRAVPVQLAPGRERPQGRLTGSG